MQLLSPRPAHRGVWGQLHHHHHLPHPTPPCPAPICFLRAEIAQLGTLPQQGWLSKPAPCYGWMLNVSQGLCVNGLVTRALPLGGHGVQGEACRVPRMVALKRGFLPKPAFGRTLSFCSSCCATPATLTRCQTNGPAQSWTLNFQYRVLHKKVNCVRCCPNEKLPKSLQPRAHTQKLQQSEGYGEWATQAGPAAALQQGRPLNGSAPTPRYLRGPAWRPSVGDKSKLSVTAPLRHHLLCPSVLDLHPGL